nr:translation initiation factor IF-2-like [Aegilops tauschii subsp. strangulata]
MNPPYCELARASAPAAALAAAAPAPLLASLVAVPTAAAACGAPSPDPCCIRPVVPRAPCRQPRTLTASPRHRDRSPPLLPSADLLRRAASLPPAASRRSPHTARPLLPPPTALTCAPAGARGQLGCARLQRPGAR